MTGRVLTFDEELTTAADDPTLLYWRMGKQRLSLIQTMGKPQLCLIYVHADIDDGGVV